MMIITQRKVILIYVFIKIKRNNVYILDVIAQTCKVLIDEFQNNTNAESLICKNKDLIYR